MTGIEREKAARIWEIIDSEWHHYDPAADELTPRQIAIKVIAAAYKRWRNEALEEAAGVVARCGAGSSYGACARAIEEIRALKKE